MLSCITGMSASGKVCISTDQVPWSMPQLSTSAPTQVGCTVVADLLDEGRQARRRVLDVEQRLREAVEVVDGAGPRHRRHRGRVDVPVRGDHEDRPRARHRGAERAPGLGVAVVGQRVHRVAVPEERGGHQVGPRRRSAAASRGIDRRSRQRSRSLRVRQGSRGHPRRPGRRGGGVLVARSRGRRAGRGRPRRRSRAARCRGRGAGPARPGRGVSQSTVSAPTTGWSNVLVSIGTACTSCRAHSRAKSALPSRSSPTSPVTAGSPG